MLRMQFNYQFERQSQELMMNTLFNARSLGYMALLASALYLLAPMAAQAQCPDAKPLQVHAFLGGALDLNGAEPIMQDSLRVHGLIPLTEPYTALGYVHVGGGGNELTHPSILSITGPDAVVDWVVVELRHPNDPGKRIATKSALLKRNGEVMAANAQPLSFCVPAGKYQVALRHRNHLGVITQRSVMLDGALADVNFRDVEAPDDTRGGWEALQVLNVDSTLFALWPGDVSFDGSVRYVGMDNDRDPILTEIGGSVPTNVVSNVYVQPDVNLDSRVQYVGQGNDRDPILVAVGGSIPTNVREDFIPDDTLTLSSRVHFALPATWILDENGTDMDSLFTMVYNIAGAMPDVQVDDIILGNLDITYIRKVTSYNIVGNTLSLTTEPAWFDALVESGTLMMDLETSMDDVSSYGPLAINFPNGLGFTGAFTNMNWDVDLAPHVEVVKYPNSDQHREITYRGRAQATGSFEYSGNLGFAPFKVPTPLVYTAPIPVGMIGPIPIIIQVAFQVEIQVAGTGGGSLAYTKYHWSAGVQLNRCVATYTTGSAPAYAHEAFEGDFDYVPVTDPQAPSFNGGVSFEATVRVLPILVGFPFCPVVRMGHAGSIDFSFNADGDKQLKYEVGPKLGLGVAVAWWPDGDASADFALPKVLSLQVPGRASLVSGWDQTGVVDQLLTAPVVVKALSTLKLLGTEVATFDAVGYKFHFDVHSGGGETLPLLDGVSNAEGRAESTWTLGPGVPNSDVQELRIHLRDGTGADVEGSPLAVAAWTQYQVELVGGNQQVGVAGEPLSVPLQAVVLAAQGAQEPVAGVEVTFEVTGGGGSLSTTTATTDAYGLAPVIWTLGPPGSGDQTVEAHVENGSGMAATGSPLTFSATFEPDKLRFASPSGNLQTPQPSTQLPQPLRVLVTNANNVPLEDQLVHFAVTSGGGYVSVIEAVTNAQGIATTGLDGGSGPERGPACDRIGLGFGEPAARWFSA